MKQPRYGARGRHRRDGTAARLGESTGGIEPERDTRARVFGARSGQHFQVTSGESTEGHRAQAERADAKTGVTERDVVSSGIGRSYRGALVSSMAGAYPAAGPAAWKGSCPGRLDERSRASFVSDAT